MLKQLLWQRHSHYSYKCTTQNNWQMSDPEL